MRTTKEMIAVMQAHEDGQPIQYKLRREGDWAESSTPAWDWGLLDYRVKPAEPRKVMMQMWRHCSGYDTAHPAGTLVGYQTKIGEPFEFVYPEGKDNGFF